MGRMRQAGSPPSPRKREPMKNLLSVFAMFAIATTTASAGAIPTPSGLVAGDQFRFVFVTNSTTSAEDSSDLSEYDAFVTSDASGATHNGVLISWQAIVSNSTTDASTHIGLTNASTVPIYLVDGTKVSAGNLWSGSLLAPINDDITGNSSPGPVRTGTRVDGSTDPAFTLGQTLIIIGYSYETSGAWVNVSVHPWISHGDKVYGISEVLTAVPSSVPEPSTAMLVGLGGLAALGYSFKRKRN